MKTPAIDRIEQILSGSANYPFDFINNPIFFDPGPNKGTEHTERLLAQAKLGLSAYMAVNRNVKPVFGPGTMSNGWNGIHLVLDNKDDFLDRIEKAKGDRFLTLQNLKYYISGDQINDVVTQPNRLENNALGDAIERANPEMSTIVPIDFEGVVRNQSDNAFSQGAGFQDWTFEHWWVPIVMLSHGMALKTGHAHSWNGNHEEITGDLIQLGFLDHLRDQEGKDYDIVDAETGEAVPLADRAWETSKHLFYVIENGFRPSLAIAAFAIRDQIDEWLRNGNGPPELDLDKVHPILKDRSPAELKRFDSLKKDMRRYIAENCADWMEDFYEQDPHLKAYFEEYILPAKKSRTMTAAQKQKLEDKLFNYQPVGGFNYPGRVVKTTGAKLTESPLKDSFSVSSRQAKRRGSDGHYFTEESKLFNDEHFKDLSPWEKAALRFVIPCMEVFRLPEAAPRTAFFAAHPKGGELAADYAEKFGVTWTKEARTIKEPTEADSFYNVVEVENAKRDRESLSEIASESEMQRRGIQHVVGTQDMLDLRSAAETYRTAIAAQGDPKLSSRAFLAMQLEWFNRNASSLVLRPGWENHPDDVALVVEAVKMATGLKDGAFDGAAYRMEIFEYDAQASGDKMRKLDMHDIVSTLGAKVEQYLDGNLSYIQDELGISVEDFAAAQAAGQIPEGMDVPAPAKEEILALARLLKITDMFVDPSRVNHYIGEDKSTGHKSKSAEIIDWTHVDRDLMAKFMFSDPEKKAQFEGTKEGQMETMRDRLRRKILEVGVLQFESKEDLKGLDNLIDNSYEAAWRRVHNLDKDLKRSPVDRQTWQVVKGARGRWGGPS